MLVLLIGVLWAKFGQIIGVRSLWLGATPLVWEILDPQLGCEETCVKSRVLSELLVRRLGCHAGCQEVGRCGSRGESQGTCNVTRLPPLSSNKAEPTLALKPRGHVTRSPKQGHQWPHKKDSCPPKN